MVDEKIEFSDDCTHTGREKMTDGRQWEGRGGDRVNLLPSSSSSWRERAWHVQTNQNITNKEKRRKERQQQQQQQNNRLL